MEGKLLIRNGEIWFAEGECRYGWISTLQVGEDNYTVGSINLQTIH